MSRSQAIFRFYEELNDFLPACRIKVPFSYAFDGSPSVKDAIEAMGVPHVEVDLILVNGESVDFTYGLQDGDRVSVYPVFETLDISSVRHLSAPPLRFPKFILDVHLGKLAKYLRLLGLDVLYRTDYDDKEIIRIARAEHRIILTRDVGLLKVKSVTHGYWIRNQQAIVQTREVLDHFDLYNALNPFSRCVKCNGILEKVAKEEVLEQLEPLTRKCFDTFYRCSGCGSIYWEGSHIKRMQEFVKKMEKKKRLR